MGIDANAVKLLLVARSRGASFRRTATIGRQELCLDERELRRILNRFGIVRSAGEIANLYTEADGYAEPLLRLLGAEHVDSLDASTFEGASLIHDMNRPIPDEWKSGFTLVIDGGALEHVFAFPTAIQNCMAMVAVGGHFLGISPTNNYVGHGFYQFSPELYFRLFTAEHGFRLEKLVVFRRGDSRWYSVVDPAQVGRRVTLSNSRPTLMAVIAEKAHEAPPLLLTPQQSDYSSQWNKHEAAASPQGVPSLRRARRHRGESTVRRALVALKQAWRGGYHPRYYVRDRSGDGLHAG